MNRRAFVGGGLVTAGLLLAGCSGEDGEGERASQHPDALAVPGSIVDGLEPLEGLAAPYMGISDNDGIVSTAADNPDALSGQLARVKLFGNVLRMDLDAPDGSLEAVHDRIMDEAVRQGLGVIGVGAAYVTDPEVAGRYTAHIADRYGPKNGGPLYWIEADNEPNTRMVAADYIPLLMATAQSVKDADSGIKVVTGGLAPGDNEQNPIVYLDDVLKGLDRDDLKQLDGFGIHPYDSPSLTHQEDWSTWARMEGSFPQIMRQHGVKGWPIYQTENGAPTAGAVDWVVTPDQQRDIVQWVAEHRIPGLNTAMRLIYVSHEERFDDPNDPEGHYGIDGKPAGAWLQQRIAQARDAA